MFFILAKKTPLYFETVRDGQHKKIYENLPHTHHFHFSYQLLPSQDQQPAKIFKTDVVVFGGIVSKVYTDIDTRVIQGCPDDDDPCDSEEGEGNKEEKGEKKEGEKPPPSLRYSWKHR